MVGKSATLLIAGLAILAPTQTKIGVRWVKAEEKKKSYEISVRLPYLVGDSVIAKSVNGQLKGRELALRAALAESLEDLRPNNPYNLTIEGTVGQVSTELCSVLVSEYMFTGGAHGNTNFTVINRLMKNGKATIFGSELITQNQDQLDSLNALIIEKLRDRQASAILDGSQKKLDSIQMNRFVVTPFGISWVFPPYDVGPYSEGIHVVKISWADLDPFISDSSELKKYSQNSG